MTASPLARVIAPKTAAVPSTKVAEAIIDKILVKPTETRPNFGAVIDKVVEENKLFFTPYVDTEVKVRADAARITAVLAQTFPDWEVIETIKPADYKPPFAVSWDFKKKGA